MSKLWKEVDLAIVGAGLHGIAMAKTYHAVHPEASILIIDRAKSLGGSWAEERLYPRLKTNNGWGTYEYADFTMERQRYQGEGVVHIPGRVVHDYMSDAALHFDVAQYLLLDTTVETATLRDDDRWDLNVTNAADATVAPYLIVASKLVLATGLTSEPNLPRFSGMADFDGLILHSKQLKEQAAQLAQCRKVVVIGGNKSAWDVCYDAAKNGADVHMVIRPSGGGPSYLIPRRFKFGWFLFNLVSLSSTRALAIFDPAPFGPRGVIRRLLHETWIGSKICRLFWRTLDSTLKAVNRYDDHPETKKLEPWTTPFWIGNSLSINNYETDWFQLVRDGKIHVHISEVSSVEKRVVCLQDGSVLPAEALVCCTGWKAEPTIRFVQDDIRSKLGFSTSSKQAASGEMDAMKDVAKAVPYLAKMARRLANAPPVASNTVHTPPVSPMRYRFVVPWQPELLLKRNFAVIGAHSSIHAMTIAEAQALWITAHFDDKIPHLRNNAIDLDRIRRDAMFYGFYTQVRRPRELGGSGGKYPDLVFDSMQYVDQLLRDLGLQTHRKESWWSEFFASHPVQNYRGLVDEWISRVDHVKGTRNSDKLAAEERSLL